MIFFGLIDRGAQNFFVYSQSECNSCGSNCATFKKYTEQHYTGSIKHAFSRKSRTGNIAMSQSRFFAEDHCHCWMERSRLFVIVINPLIFLSVISSSAYSAVIPALQVATQWKIVDSDGIDDFSLFNYDTPESNRPASSLLAKIGSIPARSGSAGIHFDISAQEAYFMEDSRLSEFSDPTLFYIKSNERDTIDLTGNNSPVPIYHSDKRPSVTTVSPDRMPVFEHEPNKWESVQEVLDDMLFIGAWTDFAQDTDAKSLQPLDRKRQRQKQMEKVTKDAISRNERVRHDET